MNEPSTDVQTIAAVNESWSRVSSPARQSDDWVSGMTGMAAARSRIVASGGWTSGPSTMLGVLQLSRAEVQNCRVIRWLLDPLARHGFGAVLVKSLCDYFGVPMSEPELARIYVEVTRCDTRADIVVEGLDGGGMLVIEAKIDAAEGPRQAHRLETLWPESEVLGFLTVGGVSIPWTATDTARWRPISWRWFATEVTRILDALTSEDLRTIDARRAAADWASGTRRNLS